MNTPRRIVEEAARYDITNLNARRIDLSGKGLTKIPDFVFYMKNLQELYLSNNKITTLPSEIRHLKKLDGLDLNRNKLVSLPPEFGQLKNLETLQLSKNKLVSLSESIGQLKKLKVIGLGDNNLSTLPESIGQLQKLEMIDLAGNNITSLPESFKNLPDDLFIGYGSSNVYNVYTKKQFMKKFIKKNVKQVRINKNTELLNSTILPTNNIPRGKRVYLNTPSNVKNNGTLRRVYNKNGINQILQRKEGRARLHGNSFTANNVKPLNNKNFNLQRIRVRLLNTPLNNMRATIEGVKNRLPPNVSRTDVNNVVRKIKPLLLNKIRNKLRTTPANNRRALLNRYKRDGLINNRDVL